MTGMLFVYFLLLFQGEVPFKPKESFEVKFDMTFKQRPYVTNANTIVRGKAREVETVSTDPLPYLILNVKIFEVLPEETRVRVYKDSHLSVLNKKTSDGMEFKLDLGFTADIRDRISGYRHSIEFMSASKNQVSRIVIEFDKDGNCMINGEKKGKI